MIKAAVVVAHCDDETIWMGGLIVSHPEIDWTIIACTIPRRDPIRSWKFFQAVDALGAKGQLIPFMEPDPELGLPYKRLDLIDLTPYDRIVTHGKEGGYGHVHHCSVHNWVMQKWGHKEVWSDAPPGKSDYDHEVVLSDAQLAQKMTALMAYNHMLPYQGVVMPKAAALIKRYCQDGGYDLSVERYRIHRPA